MIRFNATVRQEGYRTAEDDIDGPWVHWIQPDARGAGPKLLRWHDQLPEGARVLLVNDRISEVQS